jgi:eukaryotic-like serine/threonine-protein kinase
MDVHRGSDGVRATIDVGVAGPKTTEGNDQPTVTMPVGPGRKPGAAAPASDATEVLGNQVFAKLSVSGKTRIDQRPPLDFSKNKQIGRFEMIREIARGGMGQVFLARDTKLGRKVAIKFLLHDDPDFVQRFLVEARATARCTHENIITIFEVGEHEGLPYMVLEYLEGKTLSQVLEGKPSLKQFTELMISVVRALERAHSDGIVHRDLKPSNIFVTDRGQVKVLDFGVARLIDRAGEMVASVSTHELKLDEHSSSVTRAGSNSLVGTMPYMSPEQWGAGEVDHLSDLWAVGIMFWRALTDVHPAGTMHPERLRARLLDLVTPLPSLRDQDAKIPDELSAIVDKLLAKKKENRYQNATDALADLQAFVAPHDGRTGGGAEACPYRGLAAFGEDDAKYFFGRSNEIRTALAQLDSWPLLAVIGPSGVGKSSFVHAGLVPGIRSSGNWQVRVLRPGRAPLLRLAAVLEEALATGEQSNDWLGQLVEAPGLFGKMLRTAAARRNHRTLVVVDQLEELFTLCDSDDHRKIFLAAILAAADDPSSAVRVVLSMRADFLDRLAGHKHFLSELSRGLFFLTAPDQENLRETLVRPAELAGYSFEDEHIVEDMMLAASSRGALPLLSFAATRLWDSRDRTKKQLTRKAYDQMGGVGGAFARHADQVASSVAPQNQILLRAIMTRLVTPEGTRAVVDHEELLSISKNRKEIEQIIDTLVRARLIHVQTDNETTTVEIVHEMLITEWPTLKRWLEDSHAVRGFMHELRQAARQWDSHNRSSDHVWRGAPAQEALSLAKRHVLDLSAVETAYLKAVRVQVARARRRRVLVFAMVLGVLVVILFGGAWFTVQLKQANDEAREKEANWYHAAQEAQAAKADLQKKLDIINEKERLRLEAEAAAKQAQDEVIKADQGLKLSQEELEKANVDLRKALVESQIEKQRAQNAAELAKKATAEAKQAKALAEAAAAKEKARADKLEQESKSIYNKDLRRKPLGGAAGSGGTE